MCGDEFDFLNFKRTLCFRTYYCRFRLKTDRRINMKNRLLALPVMALFLSPFVNNDEPLAQTPGLDFSNMDTSATPGTDFFQYACGGWMKKNPIPNEYARFGTFDQLAENNRKQLHDLILGLSA